MALLECNFFSDALGMCCSVKVILPQRTMSQIGLKGVAGTDEFPVLYLLHGLSDDHTIWLRRTSIERYVADRGLAVIMPCVHRSFYSDMAHGYRYWTFISEELPRICHSFFRISNRREHTFVAGLSMGGYGAFKLALRCPQKFAAAASLSGALDMSPAHRDWGDIGSDLRLVFGAPDRFAGSPNDLLHLAAQVAKGNLVPKLWACCGTDDFLLNDNRRFRDHAAAIGLKLDYHESPGSHEWGYWDREIQEVLKWLPLPDVP